MAFFEKMEQKFGRYAIRNLMLYICLLYVCGFVLNLVKPEFYWYNLSLDMERILHGEIWRLLTFVIYPPTVSPLWFLVELYLFYMIGRNLENLWGSFYFNLYYFIGVLSLILAALDVYLVTGECWYFTTTDLYLSFLMAFGITLPDMMFYFFFIIPVKAKYLTIFYGGMIAVELVMGDWVVRVSVLATIVNFLIFFLLIRNPVMRVRQRIRKAEFTHKMKEAEKASSKIKNGARHRCAVCGRSELDDPALEFRYCSKCTGGLEYCMEHLYTHAHVVPEVKPHDNGSTDI